MLLVNIYYGRNEPRKDDWIIKAKFSDSQLIPAASCFPVLLFITSIIVILGDPNWDYTVPGTVGSQMHSKRQPVPWGAYRQDRQSWEEKQMSSDDVTRPRSLSRSLAKLRAEARFSSLQSGALATRSCFLPLGVLCMLGKNVSQLR